MTTLALAAHRLDGCWRVCGGTTSGILLATRVLQSANVDMVAL